MEEIYSRLDESTTDDEFTHLIHIDPKRKRPDLDGTPWGIGKTKKEADADKKATLKWEVMNKDPKTYLYRVHKDAVGPKGGQMIKFGKVKIDHEKKEITLK